MNATIFTWAIAGLTAAGARFLQIAIQQFKDTKPLNCLWHLRPESRRHDLPADNNPGSTNDIGRKWSLST